jgi:tetratricopeptide (TPR) repeat protein
MPKIIKKRPARKKPVQEDEVKSAALQALDKIKERQRQVITGLSAVAVMVVLYVAFALYSSSLQSRAYSLEREAYQQYYGETSVESTSAEEKWKTALNLYNKSLDVKETPSALFYAGNCYYNLKDYDNAIKQYTRFIDTFSSDKGILPLVYQKLASAYFQTNQNDKGLAALAGLKEVDSGIFRDTALVLEARQYERTEEKEKALETYRKIIADFPASPWGTEANSKVSAEEKKQEASAENETDEGKNASEDPKAEEGEKADAKPEQAEKPDEK